jgi:putative (di)nucleoside polyphosphate hydrolase
MLIYNRQGQVWIGHRAGAGTWQLPQGGVEPECSLEENALREVQEELGVAPHHLGPPRQLEATHRYDWLEPARHFKGRYRGQEQTFWLIAFLGPDSAIQVTTVHHPEFSEWRWVEAEEVEEAVEDLRRPGYRAPLQEFIAFRASLLRRE